MKAVFGTKALLAASVLASWCASVAMPAGLSQYGDLPLAFEANRGQAPESVHYQARGGAGYTLLLERSAASMVMRAPNQSRADVLRLSLVRAAAVRPAAEKPLGGRSNYVLGDDPNRWVMDVPHYGRVRYPNVYPGIDWVYYGNQRTLEYDFVVAPGADPGQIRLKIEGAKRLRVDRATGDLLLDTGHGILRHYKPLVYQLAGDRREPVAGRYVLAGRSEVAFELGAYDRSRTVVIDPVMAYWTYLGGPAAESAEGIAVDGLGNAYITGGTASTTGFPVQGAAQGAFGGGGADAFVTKINAAGTQIVYSTYLGGSGADEASGIAVDSRGHAYITGYTSSPNFPRVSPLRSTVQGQDAFLTRLSENGAIAYSTYLGGSGNDVGEAVAVDSAFNMYVTGATPSTDFQGLNAATRSGEMEAFVIKVLASGTQVGYGVYAGGASLDSAYAIALDPAGNAYITGVTFSAGIATPGGSFQANLAGSSDAFVAKFNTTGARVYWAYYGGAGTETARGIAVDAAGSAYITGLTNSTALPVQNAYQGATGGGFDAFAVKLTPAGNGLAWATFLGGSGTDEGNAIALIGDSAVVAGQTASQNFPLLSSAKAVDTVNLDAFVTRFASNGSTLVYSSLAGGNGSDMARGVAVDGAGAAYLAGRTSSNNVASSIPGRTLQGTQDAFVTKLQEGTTPSSLSLNRTQLYYGVAARGRTGAQPVQVTVPQGVNWVAASNQPHIRVSPTSGFGSGTFDISLDPAATGTLASGTVTVSVPGAGQSQTVQVSIASVAGRNPEGVVDTPSNGATNLSGAIGVTGWAVDDTEVVNISVWRNPLAGEPVHGNGHVYIGDGVFLDGARPDVANIFPTHPLNTRAGWGMQILTNMLPNTNGQAGTGNGTHTLYVYATDREGNVTLLGSRTISVNNAAATRPFGTIATPRSGEEVSGVVTNFGWALTPRPATIPTDGSTIWVFVDGRSLGHPTYNQFRQDIATLFPNYNNANGAVGYFHLDTTQLTNGMHSIAWSVTDNQGRIEGIGSRLFWVRNLTTSDAPQTAPEERAVELKSDRVAARSSDGMHVRMGWDPEARLARLEGDELVVKQGGRIELHAGDGLEMMTFNGSTELPVGSTLDAGSGVFYWQLDPAYTEAYDLAFHVSGASEPRRVRVRVVTKGE